LATEPGKKKNHVLFEINASKPLPIASLSKLLTAYVVLKNYSLEQKVSITQEIVNTEENKGQFRVGEQFTIEELLYSMLVESSNDAASALASIVGEKEFVKLINSEVDRIGLNYTHFVDPIGLDPDFPNQTYNYSTANDLALLTKYILEESKKDAKIAKLVEIIGTPEHSVVLANGIFHHRAITTNKLLDEFPDIIGAKTVQTPMAGQCFLVIMQKPKGDGYIINVILGSQSRFQEMKNIINWLNAAFVW